MLAAGFIDFMKTIIKVEDLKDQYESDQEDLGIYTQTYTSWLNSKIRELNKVKKQKAILTNEGIEIKSK